jgi:hypothetical protein
MFEIHARFSWGLLRGLDGIAAASTASGRIGNDTLILATETDSYRF